MTDHLKVVKDPDKIKIGLENTRSDILNILKEDDYTIKEIAEELDKDRSTIYRHIKKLEDADYVKYKKTEDGKKKYSRVAHTIFLDVEYLDFEQKLDVVMGWQLDFKKEDLVRMGELGYKNEKSEKFIDEIYSFLTSLDKRVKERAEHHGKDIRKTDFTIIFRAKLLAYLILCCKDPEFKERAKDIFSKFESDHNFELFEGDHNR